MTMLKARKEQKRLDKREEKRRRLKLRKKQNQQNELPAPEAVENDSHANGEKYDAITR